MVRIGVVGSGGRMGKAIIAALHKDKSLHLQGVVERGDAHERGAAGPSVARVTSELDVLAVECDVLVDFSHADAVPATLAAARRARVAVVIGTTGLSAADHAAIDAAARDIAVLQTANTSVGVAVLARLVANAAAALPDWDIDIVDLHHRGKRDAPSGTALALGAAAAAARGLALADVRLPSHSADGPVRPRGTVGFASLRAGSTAGDHMVLFAGDGERIELHHRAESRDIFAAGAVRAAVWLAGRPPGRYTMDDVLGPGAAGPTRP